MSAPPNPLVRHLVSQFARPRGPLGHVAGRIMATRGSNVERNQWLIDRLAMERTDRVLEIGPGPGVAIETAARVVTVGRFTAVDHSSAMLRQTARRNRRLVAAGRLSLIRAGAERLPDGLGPFDRVYAMNVWQFWADQQAVIGGLRQLLDDGGMLALGYQPRHEGATADDTETAGRGLADQFAAAGLSRIETHRLDLAPVPVTCVTGRR